VTYFLHGEPGLLQRFRDGDRQALEGVYRVYADAVARVVAGALRRYGGDNRPGSWKEIATELPDLVQEVFIRAFEPQTRLRFDGSRPYGPYLGQITRNVVVDHLRRKWRHAAVDLDPLIDEISLQPTPHFADQDFADWKTMALVDRYVAGLPTDLQRVHDALYVRGLSQRDAAAALGMGRQVIRTLESRLRGGLRAALEEIGYADASSPVAAPPSIPFPGDEKAGGTT
jgi:RNA polymerase sigma factor (sigma-70 family)